MPILPSDRARIQELLRQLDSEVAAERESAVARLTLLGPRSLLPLQAFLGKAKTAGRLAALDVLEGLGEARGLDSVLPLTRDSDDHVARRAMEVAAAFPDARAADALRTALGSRSPSRRRAAVRGLLHLHRLGLVEAVEPLLGRLLDGDEDETLRLDVLESLSSLDRRSLLPALRALANDRSPALAQASLALDHRLSGLLAKEAPRAPEVAVPNLLARLVSAKTPAAEIPAVLEALVKRRSPALLPLLGRRLEALADEAAAKGGEATARSKARIHLALGALGSRIALHDLREMLKARPLHAGRDLLAAAELLGDGSFVPALAALAADEPRLAEPTATAFRAIAQRVKLRRTSRVVKELGPKQSAALATLWPDERGPSGRARRDRSRKTS